MNIFIKVLSISVIILNFLTCQKEGSRVLEVPEDYEIDVDNDGESDFKVRYGMYTWDGFDAAGSGWIGSVESLNKEENYLYQYSNSGLSLSIGDKIKQTPEEPYRWATVQYFVTIDDQESRGTSWPDHWQVKCNKETSCEYIGFKMLNTNGEKEIGWLKVQIDENNGTLTILDIYSTTETQLVIP